MTTFTFADPETTPMDVGDLTEWLATHPHVYAGTPAGDLLLRRLRVQDYRFASDTIINVWETDGALHIETHNTVHKFSA